MNSFPVKLEPRRFVALFLGLGFFALACGSDDGGGPPSAGEYDDSEIVASVMGTCQKLCCADSDCDAGGECVAFDSTFGTLGTCTTASGQSGSLGTSLPTGCWTGSTPGCELVTGGGCDEGELCDLDEGDEWLDPAILCSPGLDTHSDGEACDAVYGPYCNAGYHCRPDANP